MYRLLAVQNQAGERRNQRIHPLYNEGGAPGNPTSESQFKTLKSRPDFPERFGSMEDARAHCRQFLHWYTPEHRPGGSGLMTPAAVHDGTAAALTAQRALTLDAAYAVRSADR